ncbi:maleylpyruvate isomerase family mycothiol-dependent enzyme [Nocardioides humilatus]|uniref:Maleylpyruvate isomerase family mycothiol-dependent enzyme n=1 Tax=Nocardioides humilatus TaxID=2607660 RepID=A0A5B1LAL2_9ACTN|nr:maleylpyruvate isomerase family mycothiol-dependent enzyme [Nocardioides humilatus]KAA1416820.1 maleylpyruvate isomerase family mycothiol-dependent enzyme [Nocardioides humilatus]
MADESLLDGLDPFDLLDREADRVHRFFTSEPDWSLPSRCAGWTVRDMVAHLKGLEDYTRANLDGTVQEMFRAAEQAGIKDIAAFNDWQIHVYDSVPTDELVGEWREAQVANRRDLRARGRDGSVDTMVGAYPAGLQTFHFAVEYATHGDDVFVPVPEADRAARTAWRVTFGRFVLGELEKPVTVAVDGGVVVVEGDLGRVELSPETFVEATQGRLSDDFPMTADLRALLSTVP